MRECNDRSAFHQCSEPGRSGLPPGCCAWDFSERDTWGVEPPAGGSLFPEEVPEGLTDVDFESLDGAWAE